eukprot:176320-Chlamydomonas_euryale.AAC.4
MQASTIGPPPFNLPYWEKILYSLAWRGKAPGKGRVVEEREERVVKVAWQRRGRRSSGARHLIADAVGRVPHPCRPQ